jgi:hypothetical protein
MDAAATQFQRHGCGIHVVSILISGDGRIREKIPFCLVKALPVRLPPRP